MIKRMLHTRYRVNDLDKTAEFYKNILGLKEVSRHKSSRGSLLAFFEAPQGDVQIELCQYEKSGPVKVQEDLTHIAFEVDDLEAFAREVAAKGHPLSEEISTTSSGSKIAFIDGPEGYEFELIQKAKK